MRTLIRPIALAAFVLTAPFLSAQPATKAADKAAPQAATPQTATKLKAPPAAAVKITQIDINTASAAELEAFPGIGKVIAGKIIAGRPYANKGQLVQKKILTQKAYDAIKEKLIAKQ